jgi:DNA-binding GntR family transcriptional regulator
MTTAQQRIIADIEDQVATGRLRPGARLPSIAEMAVQYRVSHSTVKGALSLLRDRGVVVGQQGVGVFVAARPRRRRR